MKNFDLNNYGVQELNAQELQNVDGGGFTDGTSDCYLGKHRRNGGFWYQVGWFVECMAGGYAMGKPY